MALIESRDTAILQCNRSMPPPLYLCQKFLAKCFTNCDDGERYVLVISRNNQKNRSRLDPIPAPRDGTLMVDDGIFYNLAASFNSGLGLYGEAHFALLVRGS